MRLTFILSCVLFLISTTARAGRKLADKEPTLYGLNTGYSFIKQPNCQLNITAVQLVEHKKPSILYRYANTRYIEDENGGGHISINALFYPAGYPLYRPLKSKWIYAPEWLPNSRVFFPLADQIGPPLFGLSLYAGQNTEYYLSSKGGKIFTESVAGLWIFPMLPVMVDYRVPWTKGYLKNKRPYLSASIEINQLSVFVIALLMGAKFEWD
jgi:hypothetical protein